MIDIDFSNLKKVHFIGIGGIGVSAIARMMLLEGKEVSGSDQSESLVTEELAKLGAKIFIGQKSENISSETDLIIYTIAIPHDNPERVAGEHLNIPAITYPEALGQISKSKTTVAVAGTHGKTTTTAMLAQIALAAKLEPTVVVGSFLFDENNNKTNFVAGSGNLLIAEACEYKRSFLNLSPKVVVITNIDEDHLDYYKDLADIQSAFIELVQKLPSDGVLICDTGAPNLAPVVASAKCNVVDYTEEGIEGLNLLVPGEHNISNARAALGAARVLGVDPSVALDALNTFKGTWRRFEFKGELLSGALVYDDYAHHPTEIKATLRAARDKFPERRIVAIFQPHLYSRTKLLLNDFAESFTLADEVLIAPIYAARETPDPTITSELLAQKLGAKAKSFNNLVEIEDYLKIKAEPNDLIITIGAGNVCEVADALLS
ncbi:MAG: UDP-N-acetylmuramate--L-alanine ligase [Candidatus Pacebacteria bacterium]|nr:UDP-N-acetylmuramate--L-alanine ligase [Candidatus Paceibacterota bacterium]